MTGYHIGAFEALQWAWNMLRNKSTKKGREEIRAILTRLGGGERINFKELSSK